MEKSLKAEIEEYVSDWHCDEASEQNAFEMGKFFFSFLKYLEDHSMSQRTKRNHTDNAYFIGMFEMGYGYNEDFHPEDLIDGPYYEYEYERKVSDSTSAKKSYQSTWRKLDKFIKSGEYEAYLSQIEARLKQEENDS